MKAYFTHDDAGRLVGTLTYFDHPSQLGGWPDHYRLDDPTSSEPVVQARRAAALGRHGVVGFIAYDCPCSPAEANCQCLAVKYASARVVAGQLVDKKVGGLALGGSPVVSGSLISRPPGASVVLKVVAAGVGDGQQVRVFARATPSVMESEGPLTLGFTNGETPTFTLVAPAQGLVAELHITGDDLQPIRIRLRGWA